MIKDHAQPEQVGVESEGALNVRGRNGSMMDAANHGASLILVAPKGCVIGCDGLPGAATLKG